MQATKFCIKPIFSMLLIAFSFSSAMATETDLSNVPLVTGLSNSTQIKPNIALVIDDSGSMDSQYIPDSSSSNSKSCFGYYLYNGMAYNPAITYKPPFNPAGTTYSDGLKRYPDAVFTAARDDGYNPNSSTKNLSRSRNDYSNGYYYGYKTNSTVYYYYTTSSTTSTACESNGTYTPVTNANNITAPGGVDPKTNYANWYSYYRKRVYMAKAAVAEAFSGIGDKYRVGLFFLNGSNAGSDTRNAGNVELPVRDFTESNKLTWYSNLFSSDTNGYTPTRGALSRMGRMYAGRISGWDPVQYSCQRNFSIITSDGYWNTNDENSGYGPYRIDNSTNVGNQDGTSSGLVAPYRDNNNASNTLADIAQYYYATDLRTPALGNCSNTIGSETYTGLCDNNVFQSEGDENAQQHMATFTVGLGLSGNVLYQDNYETAADTGSLDFYDILNKGASWPTPSSNNLTAVDDLWHAAVNGRGRYYSTRDPDSLAAALTKALSAINETLGSSAAVALTGVQLSTDDYAYKPLYRTYKWDGDIKAYAINAATAEVSNSSAWSAQSKLDTAVAAAAASNEDGGRKIKYFNSGVTGKLKEFTYSNLDADGKGGYFSGKCSSMSNRLSQCADSSFTTAMKNSADNGSNMIGFLRGQKTYEKGASIAANQLYRERDHVLGDIVNSSPLYIGAPVKKYEKYDSTYATFKANHTSRAGTVYVGANDGMLHAFNASNGNERWAYVPSYVMPNMYKLADSDYGNNHTYFVDGTPVSGDICTNPTTISTSNPTSTCNSVSNWKTILVGGLNKGGKGYYALDVTDPINPKGLWEFTDDDMGYTYGNPIITRRKDGKWVVMITSGYNNSEGKGYLYVLDAHTGTQLEKISTGAGSSTSPSGLAKINARVNDVTLNTTSAVYGGDLLGNLWRFDFDDNYLPSGKEATLLANFSVSGTPQAITVKPMLSQIKYAGKKYLVVTVGTGKYLGVSDFSNTQLQSIYAVSDTLTTGASIGNARSSNQLVNRAVTTSGDTRTTSGSSINWSEKRGWYLDLADSGERVNTDMVITSDGVLTAAGNVPSDDACSSGGYAWLYNIDVNTGRQVVTANDDPLATKYSDALIVGITGVLTSDGTAKNIINDSKGNTITKDIPEPTGSSSPNRTMWREVFD